MLPSGRNIYSMDELLNRLTTDGICVDPTLVERAKMKDAEAFYLIGQRYYLKDSYLKAMIWFLKAAYYCNTAAQYYIGRMFDYGLDVPKCEIKALKWYHRSTALENNPISLRIKKLNSEGYYLDAMERATIINEMTLPDSKRCYQEFIEDMQYEYQTRLKIQESQNKESIEKAVIFQAQGSQLQEDTQYEIRTLQEQVYNQQESFRKCERENHELNEKVELLENQRQTLEGRIKTLENECEKNQKSGNSV